MCSPARSERIEFIEVEIRAPILRLRLVARKLMLYVFEGGTQIGSPASPAASMASIGPLVGDFLAKRLPFCARPRPMNIVRLALATRAHLKRAGGLSGPIVPRPQPHSYTGDNLDEAGLIECDTTCTA